MLKGEHEGQVERECVTYTRSVALHGTLGISLKALNLLIAPPVTAADQARTDRHIG